MGWWDSNRIDHWMSMISGGIISRCLENKHCLNPRNITGGSQWGNHWEVQKGSPRDELALPAHKVRSWPHDSTSHVKHFLPLICLLPLTLPLPLPPTLLPNWTSQRQLIVVGWNRNFNLKRTLGSWLWPWTDHFNSEMRLLLHLEVGDNFFY